MTHELSRYLFLAGATPVVLLGAAHACLTPRRPGLPTGLSPADPHLAELMSQTRLRLTPRTDMWRAWVGSATLNGKPGGARLCHNPSALFHLYSRSSQRLQHCCNRCVPGGPLEG